MDIVCYSQGSLVYYLIFIGINVEYFQINKSRLTALFATDVSGCMSKSFKYYYWESNY